MELSKENIIKFINEEYFGIHYNSKHYIKYEQELMSEMEHYMADFDVSFDGLVDELESLFDFEFDKTKSLYDDLYSIKTIHMAIEKIKE